MSRPIVTVTDPWGDVLKVRIREDALGGGVYFDVECKDPDDEPEIALSPEQCLEIGTLLVQRGRR